MDDLEKLKQLAGIGHTTKIDFADRMLHAADKARIMKEQNIQPGTSEWFELWFSRSAGDMNMPVGFKGRKK